MQPSIQTINKPQQLTITSDFSKLDKETLNLIFWKTYHSIYISVVKDLKQLLPDPSELREKTTFLWKEKYAYPQWPQSAHTAYEQIRERGYDILVDNDHFLAKAFLECDDRCLVFLNIYADMFKENQSFWLRIWSMFPWLGSILETPFKNAPQGPLSAQILENFVKKFDPTDEQSLMCNICYENTCLCANGIIRVTKCCKKLFHEDCFDEWEAQKNSCPCCRSSSPGDAFYD